MRDDETGYQLSGERVTLRPWTKDDSPALVEACNHPSISERLPVPQPYRTRHAHDYVETFVPQVEADGGRAWAVTEGGTVVGSLTLRVLPDGGRRRGRFGYWVSPDARGRGVATRAVRAALPWALTYLEEVELTVGADNPASQSVAHKAGFEEDEVLRDHEISTGMHKDTIRYIARREYNTLPLEGGPATHPGCHHNVGRAVHLTFDDGPDPTYTPKVLDVLKTNDVTATFFLMGDAVMRHPELVLRIRDEGHTIGVHGHTHSRLRGADTGTLDAEIRDTRTVIEDVTGRTVSWYRPPYGEVDDHMLQYTKDLELQVALWDVDTVDWARPGSERIAESAQAATDGSIVLMHDGRGERSGTVMALQDIIDAIRGRGLDLTGL